MATFLVVLKCNAGLLLVKREEWSGFFRDYEIALDIMSSYMPPGPGTAAIFAGGGVPKDFIQITATSVAATARQRTGESPTWRRSRSRPTTLSSAARAGPASTPSASHGERKRP